MIKSTPNIWYNIDELYTITSNGTIELNVKMPNANGTQFNKQDREEEIINLQVSENNNERNNDERKKYFYGGCCQFQNETS